jgi:hypothetical protein
MTPASAGAFGREGGVMNILRAPILNVNTMGYIFGRIVNLLPGNSNKLNL